MTLTNPRNPRWTSANSIELDVDTEQYGTLPINCMPDDERTADLFEQAKAGGFGMIENAEILNGSN